MADGNHRSLMGGAYICLRIITNDIQAETDGIDNVGRLLTKDNGFK